MNAFKAARIFSPCKLREMEPDCAAVDALSIFSFIQESDLTALKSEFPLYQAATEHVSSGRSP